MLASAMDRWVGTAVAGVEMASMLLEDGIPQDKPGAEDDGGPKHHLGLASSLTGPLQLLVASPDVGMRRVCVPHQLVDVVFLRSQVSYQRLLQR